MALGTAFWGTRGWLRFSLICEAHFGEVTQSHQVPPGWGRRGPLGRKLFYKPAFLPLLALLTVRPFPSAKGRLLTSSDSSVFALQGVTVKVTLRDAGVRGQTEGSNQGGGSTYQL